MKRVISILLMVVLVFSLAACGADTQEPQQTETEQQDAGTDQDQAQDTGELKPEEGAELLVWESEDINGEWLQKVAAAFEEKYGVPVNYEPVGSNDVKTKLPQDGPAGVGADVFAVPHNDLGLLVASGLVAENHNPDRINNDFVSASAKAAAYQGAVYGYPLQVETYGLFYNKEVFPEAPKNYDEIIAKANEFNDPNNSQYAFMWDVKNAYYSHGIIATYGGYVFGQGGTDKTDVGLDSAGAIEGAKAMASLKEILPVNSVDAETIVMEGLFKEGKLGTIINGPWFVAGAKESGIDFGVAPLPTMANGEHQMSFSGTRLLLVSAYSKYPNAAKLFAEFATSDEMLLDRFQTTNALPPVKALMEDEAIKNDPFVAPFLEQADYAVPMPSIVQMEYVWGPYGDAFASIWDQDVAPEEALKNAAQVVRDAIANE